MAMPYREQQHEFGYSDADFRAIKQRLYQLAGIHLTDAKRPMVYSRLSRRLRALQLTSFRQYLSYLAATDAETEHFINALTTNLTAFFREAHHFDILAEYVSTNPGVKTVWCAASSTGEEPYSIAMTLAQVKQKYDHGISILASDIDSKVLAQAKQGIYTEDKIVNLPQHIKKQFFQWGTGRYSGFVRVVPELSRQIQFKKINLLESSWPLPQQIDVIFCRNVMIYFDKPTQERLLRRMVNMLPSSGLYFAGHSENFNNYRELLLPIGKTVYRPV